MAGAFLGGPGPTCSSSKLEPNRHLNAIARQVATDTPGQMVRGHLQAIQNLELGGPVATRPDFVRLSCTPGWCLDYASGRQAKHLYLTATRERARLAVEL